MTHQLMISKYHSHQLQSTHSSDHSVVPSSNSSRLLVLHVACSNHLHVLFCGLTGSLHCNITPAITFKIEIEI